MQIICTYYAGQYAFLDALLKPCKLYFEILPLFVSYKNLSTFISHKSCSYILKAALQLSFLVYACWCMFMYSLFLISTTSHKKYALNHVVLVKAVLGFDAFVCRVFNNV